MNRRKKSLKIYSTHTGIRAPTSSITGGDLPLARTVSFTLFPNDNVKDMEWTLVAMQYGQIITHDMGLIDGTTQSSTSPFLKISKDAKSNPIILYFIYLSLFRHNRRTTWHSMLHLRRSAGAGLDDEVQVLPDSHT